MKNNFVANNFVSTFDQFHSTLLGIFRFLSSDSYLNYYITESVIQYDKEMANCGHESILPLKGSLRAYYVSRSSFLINDAELKSILPWFFFDCYIFAIVVCTFVADLYIYLLAWIYNWIMTAIAEGLMPDYQSFRSMCDQYSGEDEMKFQIKTGLPEMFEALRVRILACAQVPNPVSIDLYIKLLVLFLLLLCTSLIRAYIQRMTTAALEQLFPYRVRNRTIYLYNRIRVLSNSSM